MQHGILCMVTFTQHKVFTVHPNWRRHQYILPVCGWIIFHPMNPHHIQFHIPSVKDIWLISTLWLLWVMLPSTFMYIFLCSCVFISLGWMPSWGIAGSYGKSKLNFLWTVFWLLDCMTEGEDGMIWENSIETYYIYHRFSELSLKKIFFLMWINIKVFLVEFLQ